VIFASALGACAHYFVSKFLNARNIERSDLVVDVNMEKAKEGTPRLGTLDLSVKLPNNAPEKYAAAIKKLVEQCPVHGTLHTPPKVGIDVIYPQ